MKNKFYGHNQSIFLSLTFKFTFVFLQTFLKNFIFFAVIMPPLKMSFVAPCILDTISIKMKIRIYIVLLSLNK